MTAPLRHVYPGEPFRPKAAEWNQIIDATRTTLASREIFKPGPLLPANPDDSESGGGGSSGSSGCCCNNASCVDLCNAIDTDVILSCTACPSGALRNYKFSIGGNVLGLEDPAAGYFVVTWDSDCTWKSTTFTAGSGTYRLVLVVDSTLPYIEVQYVSGTDTLLVDDGYHDIRWNFNGSFADYSCLCNMQFKLAQANRVYKSNGLNSLICLLPLEVGELPPTCPMVINPATEEYVIPCLEFFTFPSITGADELCGYSGATDVVIPLEYYLDIDRQCVKRGGVTLQPESSPGADDQVVVTADIYYAGEVALLEFICPGHGVFCEYTSATEWVIGANVLTRSGASTMFPDTITVYLTNCTFGSSHPDSGYGCGGAAGGCDWYVSGNTEPYSWTVYDAQYEACPSGCPAPPIDPTFNATYHTDCYE